jgi:hypothetical protein
MGQNAFSIFPARVWPPAGYMLGICLYEISRGGVQTYIHGQLAGVTFTDRTPLFLKRIIAAKDDFLGQLSSGFRSFVHQVSRTRRTPAEDHLDVPSEALESELPTAGLPETISERQNSQPDLEPRASSQTLPVDGPPDQPLHGTGHDITTEPTKASVVLISRHTFSGYFCVAMTNTLTILLLSPVETYLFRHLAQYAFGHSRRITGLLPVSPVPWHGQGDFRSWASKAGLSLLIHLVIKSAI